jgi:hypothetical protein
MVTRFLRRTAALSLVALLLPPVARFVAHSVTFETGRQQGAPEALESFADLLDWPATQLVHQTSSDFVLGAFLLLSCVFWGSVFALGLEVVRLGTVRFGWTGGRVTHERNQYAICYVRDRDGLHR